MDAQIYNESDPRYHAVKIQHLLTTVLTHCREDAAKIEEPKAQALCEATAEVLNGLKTTWETLRNRRRTSAEALGKAKAQRMSLFTFLRKRGHARVGPVILSERKSTL